MIVHFRLLLISRDRSEQDGVGDRRGVRVDEKDRPAAEVVATDNGGVRLQAGEEGVQLPLFLSPFVGDDDPGSSRRLCR